MRPRLSPYPLPVVRRLVILAGLGVLSTVVVATIQSIRYDTDTQHTTVAIVPEFRNYGDWLPPAVSPPRIMELMVRRSNGTVFYFTQGRLGPHSSEGDDWDVFEERAPEELIPTALRSHLLTDWPTRDSEKLYGTPALYNRAYKSVFVAGWPMHALWCQPRRKTVNFEMSVDYGFSVGDDRRYEFVFAGVRPFLIPLRPLWPGFVVNTVLFAGMWGIVLLVPRQLRRTLRRRRGQCPRCGYDLRATAAGSPCPECGHASPSSA